MDPIRHPSANRRRIDSGDDERTRLQTIRSAYQPCLKTGYRRCSYLTTTTSKPTTQRYRPRSQQVVRRNRQQHRFHDQTHQPHLHLNRTIIDTLPTLLTDGWTPVRAVREPPLLTTKHCQIPTGRTNAYPRAQNQTKHTSNQSPSLKSHQSQFIKLP